MLPAMTSALRTLGRPFMAQVREIAADPALTRYGAALGLMEVLVAYWARPHISQALPESLAVCWPFFQSCADFRFFGAEGLGVWLWLIGGLGALACAAFLSGRVGLGYVSLAAATLLKIGFVLLDFRLRRNQHYMAVAVSLVFLLWPYKRDAIRLLIVGFYFWAGMLKLNTEWLSGSALYRPVWFFEGPWLVAACAYVVALELVIVWGLLDRRPWIFWPTLAQLVVFHIFSWPVVGYFYPILMGLILLIHPFARWWPVGADAEGSLLSRLLHRRVAGWSTVPFVVFTLLQLGPALVYPGDTALTGEGRFLSLHMFDALPVCDRAVTIHYASGKEGRVVPVATSARVHCDPWVLFAHAAEACRVVAEEPEHGIVDADLYLASRRTSQETMRVIVDEKNVCTRGLHYDWWRHNDWIRPVD